MASIRRLLATLTFLVSVSAVLSGQVLTTLVDFSGSNGSKPEAPLIQGADGDLYGTTFLGGTGLGFGLVFKVSPAGTLTTVYSFCDQASCAWGDGPFGAVIETRNGDLYGTS